MTRQKTTASFFGATLLVSAFIPATTLRAQPTVPPAAAPGTPAPTAPSQSPPTADPPTAATPAPAELPPTTPPIDAAPMPAPDQPAPPPASAPPPMPAAAPAAAPTPESKPEPKPFKSEQYKRDRGMGVFHRAQFTVGMLSGDGYDDMGAALSQTGIAATFEGAFLGMPSPYGNYHGLEGFINLRSGPGEANLGLGFPMTLLNVGRGKPMSFRLGLSFGAALGNVHSWFYAKPRLAVVIVPDRIDAEVSTLWVPKEASTGDYEVVNHRVSVWYRSGKNPRTNRFFNAYIEILERSRDVDPMVAMPDRSKELDGVGIGLGMTL